MTRQVVMTEEEFRQFEAATEYKFRDALEWARIKILQQSGFTCVHESEHGGYCDLCPVSWIGDGIDNVNRPTIQQDRQLCTRARHYSR